MFISVSERKTKDTESLMKPEKIIYILPMNSKSLKIKPHKLYMDSIPA